MGNKISAKGDERDGIYEINHIEVSGNSNIIGDSNTVIFNSNGSSDNNTINISDTVLSFIDDNLPAKGVLKYKDNSNLGKLESTDIVSVFFQNDKESPTRISRGNFRIHEIEKIYPKDAYYHAFITDNVLEVYALNVGWADIEQLSVELNSAFVSYDIDIQGNFQGEKRDYTNFSQFIAPNSTVSWKKYTSLDIGQRKMVFTIPLDKDYIISLCEDSQTVEFILEMQYDGILKTVTLGRVFFSEWDNSLFIENGMGAGGEPNEDIIRYVYINAEDTNHDVTLFSDGIYPFINNAEKIDLVLWTNHPCRVKFSVAFFIDGKELETDIYERKILRIGQLEGLRQDALLDE